MSFHEISIAVRAENRASYAFRSIVHDVLHLGTAFGLFDSQVGRSVSAVMSAVHLFASLRAALGTTAVTQKIYAAATWFATAAQNALNVSFSTFLALTGVGIAVIVAAAVAMWYFASQTNAAAASVKEYNEAVSEMPAYGRGVRRAGEEEYYRRGVEY